MSDLVTLAGQHGDVSETWNMVEEVVDQEGEGGDCERDGGSRRRREGERPARPDGPDTTLIITPNCSYHLRIGFNYDSHENLDRPGLEVYYHIFSLQTLCSQILTSVDCLANEISRENESSSEKLLCFFVYSG